MAEGSSGVGRELPRYRSHKEVFALELQCAPQQIDCGPDEWLIEFHDMGYAPIKVPATLLSRYRPIAGDFYVVYADGYQSFSPRKAFLEGYTLARPGSVPSTSGQRTVNNTMRHAYRVLTDEEKATMQAVKDEGLKFHELVAGIGNSRELSIAKTKIEEAVMWAVKHITA